MNLTRIEQETIILFNEGENEAEVYTHNAKLKKKLKAAMEKHPNLYRLKATNKYGGVTYIFPKKYLTIIFRGDISEEEQANLAKRLEAARAVQNTDDIRANLKNGRRGKANTQPNE